MCDTQSEAIAPLLSLQEQIYLSSLGFSDAQLGEQRIRLGSGQNTHPNAMRQEARLSATNARSKAKPETRFHRWSLQPRSSKWR
jgi:hypothetical protein